MRSLRRNQQPLKYSLQVTEIPELDITYFEDEEGKKYPIDSRPTGKKEILYSYPEDFRASISGSGGEAEAVEYGMSVTDYSAKLIFPKGKVPLKLGALIWHESKPEYKHIEVEIDDVKYDGDYPVKTSADYYVVKIPPCINEQVVLLQAINK